MRRMLEGADDCGPYWEAAVEDFEESVRQDEHRKWMAHIEAARAALTAAGVAAVGRDSNLVAEAVPDLGKTITGTDLT
jgi:hypothetical protein